MSTSIGCVSRTLIFVPSGTTTAGLGAGRGAAAAAGRGGGGGGAGRQLSHAREGGRVGDVLGVPLGQIPLPDVDRDGAHAEQAGHEDGDERERLAVDAVADPAHHGYSTR